LRGRKAFSERRAKKQRYSAAWFAAGFPHHTFELEAAAIYAQLGTSPLWIFRPFTGEDVTNIVALCE